MDNFGYSFDPNFNRNEKLLANDYLNKKKQIRNDCLKLGGLLILYNVLTKVFSYAYFYVAYRAISGKFTLDFETVRTYFLEEQKDLVASTSFSMAANLSVTLAGMLIILPLGKLILKIDLGGYFKPSRSAAKKGFQWAAPCFLVNLACSMAVFMVTTFLSTQGIKVPEANFTISDPSAASLILQTSYVVIFAPIIEETIYRGMILGMLSKYGKTPAVLLSALAFGLMHNNIPQAVSAFGAGLFFAIIAVNCGSIIPTMIIHMINNFIANFTDVAKAVSLSNSELIFCIMEMTMIVLGIYVLLTGYRALKFDTSSALPEKGEVGRIVFTNPLIFVYLIYMVYSIIKGLIDANL